MSTPSLRNLYRIVERHPLDKKIWIVGSYAAGLQCVRRMARELGPVTNLELRTIESLALERSKAALEAAGLSYAPPAETYWIVYGLMRRSEPRGACAPTSLAAPGAAYRFHRTLLEIREAGHAAESLVDEAFESAGKAAYLRGLLASYERKLAAAGLVDFAGLAERADPAPNAGETIYLLDGGLRLSAAARRVVARVTGGRAIALSPEPDVFAEDSGFPFAAARFFHAAGPLAEAKEALRRAAVGAPWDDTELLLSDYRTYAPVLYALCRRYEIECTFDGGVPVRFFSFGRAIYHYLDWLESGFRAEVLARALAQDVLRPPVDAEFTGADAMRTLEAANVGWGRERYARLAAAGEGMPAEEGAGEGGSERRKERKAAEWLAASCRSWLEPLPMRPEDWSPAHVAAGLTAFLDCCGAPAARGDVEAREQASALRRLLERWAAEPTGAAEACRAVRRRWDEAAVEADGVPQPGKLHVAALERGGQSGRKQSFVLGMGEEHWSSAARQDPVLLDEERERLSGELETSGSRARRLRELRGSRLGGLRGVCTASFGRRRAEGAETSPAYELLQLFRAARGRPDAGFDALSAALGEPAGWSGTAAGPAMDADDGLLRELTTPERTLRDGAHAVLAAYPSLARGLAAADARKEPRVGPYDGIVSVRSGARSSLPPAYSASALETYAKCPLLFFFQEVLDIRPKEFVAYDRTRWLDAKRRGRLLHEIYCAYVKEAAVSGRADRALLDGIAERKLAEAAERVPPPSPHTFAKERAELLQDLGVFWGMELRRRSRAKRLELTLHPNGEAFALELDGGFALPIRGVVDRIDEVEPHRYKVIDYKTGSPKAYEEGAFFAGGAQLQHALYALAAEQWLRRTGADPEARVTEAAYAFPTVRGLGEEVSRLQAGRREEVTRLLRRMLDAIEGGLFPPTAQPERCRRCDFAAVCGDHAEWKKHARAFPENRERLAPLLEVNGSV